MMNNFSTHAQRFLSRVLLMGLIFFGSAITYGQVACTAVFSSQFTANLGEKFKIIPEMENIVSQDDEVYHLGSGVFGSVFRIKEPTGNEYALKIYDAIEAHDKDLSLLRILENSLMQIYTQNPEQPHFRIIRFSKLPGKMLRLTYSRGESLDKVLKNPNLNDNLKNHLQSQFEIYKTELIAQFRKQNIFVRVGELDIITVIDRSNGKSVDINLHTGNVVVDPDTLAITIIDPY